MSFSRRLQPSWVEEKLQAREEESSLVATSIFLGTAQALSFIFPSFFFIIFSPFRWLRWLKSSFLERV